nr:MAG TPA: hypothetical protein [Caudoviricetes sp.]
MPLPFFCFSVQFHCLICLNQNLQNHGKEQ